MKKLLLVLSLVFLGIIAVLIFNTITFHSRQVKSNKFKSPVKDIAVAVNHLANAIKYQTISSDNKIAKETSVFYEFSCYLNSTYPLVTNKLQKEIVGDYSLLYKWQGKNTTLRPVILLAHIDVVPVEKESLKKWDQQPFEGIVKDGFIWGRGTMDDKISVISILEAVEYLLKQNFVPDQTIYLAFGNDEEQDGAGAMAIATLLKKRNVSADFVLDEGGIVTHNIIPGIQKPVALIGTAEKGFLSIELSVHDIQGGHSSMPARETAIGILSKAVVQLEQHPLSSRMSDPVIKFAEYVGPEMPFFTRVVFANLWLTKKLVIKQYEKTASGTATMKTTTAPTIFYSGIKDNLMPTQGRAVINFRILPGETVATTLQHIRTTIDDHRIIIHPLYKTAEPSAPSGTETKGFLTIQKAISEVFPEAIVAPYLTLAKTDARNYKDISENIYRFLPLRATSTDLDRIHGINERISITNFRESIDFYTSLIENLNIK